MPETILERHYRDRMQSVRQIVLPEARPPALSWRDFQDLATLCADLSASGRELLEREYDSIFKEPKLTVAWLQERQRVIEELSASFLDLAQSIRTSASAAWQAAGSPPEKDIRTGLDCSIQSLAEAKRSVLERWPVGSPEEIAASRAALGREEALDAEEAFAQIAGVDVATWRRHVEEYKQSRQE